jgi:hypothetical protein
MTARSTAHIVLNSSNTENMGSNPIMTWIYVRVISMFVLLSSQVEALRWIDPSSKTFEASEVSSELDQIREPKKLKNETLVSS